MVKGRLQARTRAGVVLVDIIVATVLLGAALAVLIGMTGRAMSAQKSGEQLQVAAMLLDEQLNLVLARGPDNYASRFEVAGVCAAPYEEFRYRIDFTGGEAGEAYRVVATVVWNRTGREESASVETMIAPRLGEEPDPDRQPVEPVERY